MMMMMLLLLLLLLVLQLLPGRAAIGAAVNDMSMSYCYCLCPCYFNMIHWGLYHRDSVYRVVNGLIMTIRTIIK